MRTALLAIALCVSFLAIEWLLSRSKKVPGNKKPNVLFILVDDLRPEIGAYGNPIVQTPHIDRLAKRSVLFERAYVQQAVCVTSRASLFTGVRPDLMGLRTLKPDLEKLRKTHPEIMTMAQAFKNQGYYSIGIGKIYHRGEKDSLSWSEPHQQPIFSNYCLSKNKKLLRQLRKENGPLSKGPAFESANVPDDCYTDGKIANQAIRSLRAIADKRFFLTVGFHKPHLPFSAPSKYWDLYQTSDFPTAPATTAPQDAPKFALTNFGELRGYHGIAKTGMISKELSKRLVHGYYASVSYVDAQIGKVLDELKRLDLVKNTLVVLAGDHGFKLGEFGSWSKHTNYEIDTRTPLLIKVPGQSTGKKIRSIVEFIDILPTVIDLAGLSPLSTIDGKSLRVAIEQKTPFPNWTALSQYPRKTGQGDLMGYSLRTERFRLTHWYARSDFSLPIARELYDHYRDPNETKNLEKIVDSELLQKLSIQLQQKIDWMKLRQKLRQNNFPLSFFL